MRLVSRLAYLFTDQVRKRGMEYYRQGRVKISLGNATEVEATVAGGNDYEVHLWWDGDRHLHLVCECPYYESGEPCKHLWAAILKADLHDYLSAAISSRKLIAEFDEAGDFEDDLAELEALDLALPRLAPPPTQRPAKVGPTLPPAQRPAKASPTPPPEPVWRQKLGQVVEAQRTAGSYGSQTWPADRKVLYVIDVSGTLTGGGLALEVLTQDRKRDGSLGKPKELHLVREGLWRVAEAQDREILALLAGGHSTYGYYGGWERYHQLPSRLQAASPLAEVVMPRLARTGRCALRLATGAQELAFVQWDDGGPWRFEMEVVRGERRGWQVQGVLRRGEERMELSAPVLLTAGGLVFTRERVAPLEDNAAFAWISFLRKAGSIQAPEAEQEELLAALLEHPVAPPLVVPEELRYEEVKLAPRPCLKVRAALPHEWDRDTLRAELAFDYDGRRISGDGDSRGFYDRERRQFALRDPEAEAGAVARLRELGFQPPAHVYPGAPAWQLPAKKLPRAVGELVQAGWDVQAEGKTFRRSGAFRLEVSTGVDWFELRGEVDYEGTSARLPQLLEALQRGENLVRLDDGTYGVLPEEWMRRIGLVLEMGAPAREGIRFGRHQAGLLDALLATQPEARCDETFARVRERIRSFEGVREAEQPEGFSGRLRDYQREGLGWMHFLQGFGFGGCLADDMGVGKTAQVLALLETRRRLRTGAAEQGEETPAGPSLVVAPKSLVFNWKQEAARFTPQLRVVDYTGLERSAGGFGDSDVVLTTYGTMRRDVLKLRQFEFDYVVLDEAQAVKNANTEAAKAVRLLRGRHRLALSGTPVENHLGELWSLFEFLNPGMLGAARVFKQASGAARNPDEETRRLLAHALRPFILRRTKEQVARELPPKTEQTIYCVMDAEQRRLYDELRDHYRQSLLGRIDKEGLGRSKILVLEALLRLRQAACHPGLLDPQRAEEPSAKLEVLLEHLSEVVEEGHKALVFSQFTSLLALVRHRLKARGLVYEYLDGATRDRQARVERFQNDAACPLFLLSLKAGGLGLNLTAAEYVFLLDPWWNPAVEAQAMDRAHRIGQTRHVFAYRLIARDTVEEKVLELQNTKRDLAAAIITADRSLIRDLRREDLELLLS